MLTNWSATKNIVERALSTFIQTFASVLGITLVTTPLTDWQSLKAALCSAVGAAILSVRKNLTAEGIRADLAKEYVSSTLETTSSPFDGKVTEK